MANPDEARTRPTTFFQYAVPVTIESFSKGFVAHKFWAPQHYIPQIKMFYRALYTIEDLQSISRRIRRRLPAEIIHIIIKDVKEAAVERGFRDCEQLMGALKSPASLEIEQGLFLLEKRGRKNEGFMVNPEDTVCLESQYSTGRFNLTYI
jgi:hypothetical protein